MGHSIEKLEKLKEFCNTDRQNQVIQAVINNSGNVTKASNALKKIGDSLAPTNISRMIKNIEARAFKAGLVEDVELEQPKVLIIDIETSPTKAYVWRMWKENVGNNQVIDSSYIMTVSAKWLGEDDIMYYETRTEDDSEVLRNIIGLLNEANYVVAHNGDRFDLARINTDAIKHSMNPPTPYKSIDTLKIARKHFKFERNTLEHLAQFLGCSPKLKHQKFSGFELWRECLNGNDEAWKEMMVYNMQDVATLEEVYLKLRPWHKECPNAGAVIEHYDPVCSKCGSANIKRNGYSYTDVSKFEVYTCKKCGGHSRGRENKIHKEIRKTLLTTVRG